MLDVMYEVPQRTGVHACRITRSTILGHKAEIEAAESSARQAS
jgi:ATP-dependent protease Clp ATPase subunit